MNNINDNHKHWTNHNNHELSTAIMNPEQIIRMINQDINHRINNLIVNGLINNGMNHDIIKGWILYIYIYTYTMDSG